MVSFSTLLLFLSVSWFNLLHRCDTTRPLFHAFPAGFQGKALSIPRRLRVKHGERRGKGTSRGYRGVTNAEGISTHGLDSSMVEESGRVTYVEVSMRVYRHSFTVLVHI